MRPDMHKVIVERPRRGSSGPFRQGRGTKNARLDDLPSKQGLRRRYLGTELRSLNENLAPLKRFLRKQVGRPWNKVYSEISARLRATSAVQQHVRDHVWGYVERHARIGKDGLVYGSPRFLRWGKVPLQPGDLYVHPTTGLLMAVKRRRKPTGRRNS